MVFVDKPDKANVLLEGVENKLTPGLKIIVVMDSYGSSLVERGKKCGVEIISMKAMEVSAAARLRCSRRRSRTAPALAACLSARQRSRAGTAVLARGGTPHAPS